MGWTGSDWASILAAYANYQAANEAGKPGKITNTITPQQSWLFDKLKDLMNYSPTRDYVSSYADSFIKGANAPGGMLSWKPTFQSDYMKNQPPLPNTAIDMTKLPIFQGDSTGKMPWNHGYTGPGIGGGPNMKGGTTGSDPGQSYGLQNPDGSYTGLDVGEGDFSFTPRAAGTAWSPRANNTDRGNNPRNPGGLPSGSTLPDPPDPGDGDAVWNAIRSGAASIGSNGQLIWKATGAVLGYLVMGPAGVPIGIKAGGQLYNWKNPPGGTAGAGAGAGTAGGKP